LSFRCCLSFAYSLASLLLTGEIQLDERINFSEPQSTPKCVAVCSAGHQRAGLSPVNLTYFHCSKVGAYLGIVHQRAPLEAARYIRDSPSVGTALLLLPCHTLPNQRSVSVSSISCFNPNLQPYAQKRHTPLLALHTTWTVARAWLGDEQLLPESIKVLLFMLVSRPLQRQHRWLQDTIQSPPDMVVTTDAMQPQIGEWLKKHSYSRKASFFHSRFPEPPMSTHIDVYER
jgi:hypothetical protein